MRKTNEWIVRFEVTFYGVDKESKIKFDDNFEIKNKLPFDTKENVEINFLLWVDVIPPEKLVPLPSDYRSKDVKYGEESIEVLEVNSY